MKKDVSTATSRMKTRKRKTATIKFASTRREKAVVDNNFEDFDKVVAVQIGVTHEGYSLDVTAQEARDRFEKKFGVAPKTVFRFKQLIMAGPVDEDLITRQRFGTPTAGAPKPDRPELKSARKVKLPGAYKRRLENG